jgi:hypothetical protein
MVMSISSRGLNSLLEGIDLAPKAVEFRHRVLDRFGRELLARLDRGLHGGGEPFMASRKSATCRLLLGFVGMRFPSLTLTLAFLSAFQLGTL